MKSLNLRKAVRDAPGGQAWGKAAGPPLWSWTNPESRRARRPPVQPPQGADGCCKLLLWRRVTGDDGGFVRAASPPVPVASGPRAPRLSSSAQSRSPAASCRLRVRLALHAPRALASSSAGVTVREQKNGNANRKTSGETSLGEGTRRTSLGIEGRPIFRALRVQRDSGHGEAWAPTLPLSPTHHVAPAPDVPFWEPLVSMCKSSSQSIPRALLVRVEQEGVRTPPAQE